MTEVTDLRAGAARMREFALTVTEPSQRKELDLLIAEFEARAKTLANGDGRET
jgi:hypothetical protein